MTPGLLPFENIWSGLMLDLWCSSPAARWFKAQVFHSMVGLRPRAFIVFIYCPPNCFVSSHVAHPCSYINRKLLMLHQTSRCSELQHRCTNIWCWITACFGFWLHPEWCKFNWKHLYRRLVAKFGFRKRLSEESGSNGKDPGFKPTTFSCVLTPQPSRTSLKVFSRLNGWFKSVAGCEH